MDVWYPRIYFITHCLHRWMTVHISLRMLFMHSLNRNVNNECISSGWLWHTAAKSLETFFSPTQLSSYEPRYHMTRSTDWEFSLPKWYLSSYLQRFLGAIRQFISFMWLDETKVKQSGWVVIAWHSYRGEGSSWNNTHQRNYISSTCIISMLLHVLNHR